jgi:hypothetical protein
MFLAPPFGTAKIRTPGYVLRNHETNSRCSRCSLKRASPVPIGGKRSPSLQILAAASYQIRRSFRQGDISRTYGNSAAVRL